MGLTPLAMPETAPYWEAAVAERLESSAARIAANKCPQAIEFRVQPVPLSAAGKVPKRDLRAPYWAGAVRNVN